VGGKARKRRGEEGKDTMKRVQGGVQEEKQVRKLARGAPSEEWSWDVSYIYIFLASMFSTKHLKNRYT
jgi:hypothetical protein